MAGSDRRLYRSRDDRVLGGVCGGLAKYLEVDPLIVRVVWVVVTIATVAAGAVAYILFWLLAPEEPPEGKATEAPPPKPLKEPKAERKVVAPEADKFE